MLVRLYPARMAHLRSTQEPSSKRAGLDTGLTQTVLIWVAWLHTFSLCMFVSSLRSGGFAVMTPRPPTLFSASLLRVSFPRRRFDDSAGSTQLDWFDPQSPNNETPYRTTFAGVPLLSAFLSRVLHFTPIFCMEKEKLQKYMGGFPIHSRTK